jgi:geranylgeranylglycerol-phosphate geranylgeranyltransferase
LKKIIGFIKITRVINSFMMGFAVLIGEIIALEGSFPSLKDGVLGFLTAFTLTGSSMAVNDYYDRNADAINEPNRPIPSGIVSTKEALRYAASLALLGLYSALITNFSCFIIAFLSFFISMLYNTKGKSFGLFGNFMVSFNVAMPFFYGGIAIEPVFEPLLALFSLMSFLSNTGREITKGIVDVVGDKSRNSKTIAIMYGPRRAAFISVFFYFSAILLSIAPLFSNLVTPNYVIPILVSDTSFIVCSILLIRDYSKDNAKLIKNLVLLCMFMSLVAFITSIY